MKIDLHVHTSEISSCGEMTAKEMVTLYKKAGYDAICITNHFNSSTARWLARRGKLDFVKAFDEGFELARSEGERIGLRVFKGYEFRCDQYYNDYLTYYIPQHLLDRIHEIFAYPMTTALSILRSNGVRLYQAHPFRSSITVVDPSLIDGIEVFNGANGKGEINDMAMIWANAHPHLRHISGSDAHNTDEALTSSIETDEDIRTQEDLLRLLDSGNYKLILPS